MRLLIAHLRLEELAPSAPERDLFQGSVLFALRLNCEKHARVFFLAAAMYSFLSTHEDALAPTSF